MQDILYFIKEVLTPWMLAGVKTANCIKSEITANRLTTCNRSIANLGVVYQKDEFVKIKLQNLNNEGVEVIYLSRSSSRGLQTSDSMAASR